MQPVPPFGGRQPSGLKLTKPPRTVTGLPSGGGIVKKKGRRWTKVVILRHGSRPKSWVPLCWPGWTSVAAHWRCPATAPRGEFELLALAPGTVPRSLDDLAVGGLPRDHHADAELSADAGSTQSAQASRPQAVLQLQPPGRLGYRSEPPLPAGGTVNFSQGVQTDLGSSLA